MLKRIARVLVARAERRVGVGLDYAHQIAATDFGLFRRYGRIFGFLDGNTKAPPLAYHAARLRGALAADCGTCGEAEINLARRAGVSDALIGHLLDRDLSRLPAAVAAVVTLADTVTLQREDDAEARETIRAAYGEAGLIEIAYAMNGAALLPGIKRAMGYATACHLPHLRKGLQSQSPGQN